VYKNVFVLIASISFVLLIALYFLFGQRQSTPLEKNGDNLLVEQTFHLTCPLQEQTCTLHLADDLTVSFDLLPKGLPVLQLLEFSLSSSQNNINQLENIVAWFEGVDMDMGRHFIAFPSDSPDEYVTKGQGMIPICTIDSRMTWRLTIQFSYKTKLTQINFDLRSENPHE